MHREPTLSKSEELKLLEWNQTSRDYLLDQCLHELIEEQVRRTPNQPAVRFEGAQISFAELNERANRCARYLRGLGVGPDSIVGVLMERSIEMVVALLGILKAGGAYLPLDPAYPDERLRFMLDDSGATIILTQKKYGNLVDGFEGTKICLDSDWSYLSGESGSTLERITAPENLAYVIYTSGSTGKPKGCLLPHRAICNRLLWMQEKYHLTGKDRVLQKTPYTFDVSVWEFFWPLLAGACLVMAKPEGHKDSNYLVEIIRKEKITTCHFVPSMLRFFVSNANVGKCGTLRQVFTSGEALPFDLMMNFINKLPAKLHNLYGPTEAAVDVTYWECEERPDQKVPIGRPISNIQMYILDSDLNQVPIGEEGELYIGGIGLAKGYLNRRELTAERFIPVDSLQFTVDSLDNNEQLTVDSVDNSEQLTVDSVQLKNKNCQLLTLNSKLYKTGDRAKFLADGNIDFLGRIDFQVKLRGNRVELGEIESVLRDHPAIGEAVVLVRDEASADPKLVAYIVAKGEVPASKEIREFVKRKLPDYMVPNLIVPLATLPVTQHGKLDRAALPWPIRERAGEDHKVTVTADPKNTKVVLEADIRDEISAVLRDYFTEALNITELKADEDLFDTGATSLTIVQVVEKVQKRFGVSVPVEVFLDDPTIAAIAGYIAQDPGFSGDGANLAEKVNSPVHPQPKESPRENTASEKVFELPKVEFKEPAYFKGVIRRSFVKKEIPFNLFSRFLSLLKQGTVGGEPKYLYPSAGGLNAVQTYLYIKENAVERVQKGIYYYHPEEHGLYRITDSPAVDGSIFFEYDRPVFDNAGFAIFFIAQLAAINPVYHGISPTLVTLDAGYMGELLLSRQPDFNLGLSPVAGVDFDRIGAYFKLDPSHRFIHCLLGGIPDGSSAGQNGNEPGKGVIEYIQKTGKRITGHIQNYNGERTFASFLEFDFQENLKNIDYLNKEEHDRFHSQHLNIRRFPGGETVIALDQHHFRESDYRLRSCRRDYLEKPVTFQQLGKFLALFRREHKAGRSCYLYPSLSGTYVIQAYLYIKENGVEGLAEGIYFYDSEKHGLELITAPLTKKIKPSYTPFNRKHFQKSAFSLFLIGWMEGLRSVYQEESQYFALLEAGYLGQLLMDKQAEFGMGICPIGGVNFERSRSDFKLDEGQELLHSFTCGCFEQEIPEDREFLEVGREERKTALQFSGRVPLTEKRSTGQQDLAIVGISGRYPGAANLDAYWDNLKRGRHSFRDLPESRGKLWGCEESEPGNGLEVSSRGGYLEDIDCFDSLLFGISPFEANVIDPQERLLLETVWECLENAGYTAENLFRTSGRIGVFIGAMWSDYQNQSAGSGLNSQEIPALAGHSSIANRISYFFNFNGPSIAIDTSCSSAMTAIHYACESIKKGECEAAIAGGVNLMTHFYHRKVLTNLDLLSKDGECRPFGAQANGWVPGEGVGVILIKPVEYAERDRDYIHGLIKGTAIGHSGRTARFGAPRSAMQAESIQKAIFDAGVAVESIGYIEAAAPGASIADASEVEALKKLFLSHCSPASPCLVGSVKANIGHLESASAMSQITKVLLQMKHRQVAPTINFQPINPLLQLQGSGLEIAAELQPWRRRNQENEKSDDRKHLPLRALINAFGATGSGGHLIIEEYLKEKNQPRDQARPALIPISAASEEQLRQQVFLLYEYLTRNETGLDLSDIGFTLRMGRVSMEERLAVIVESIKSLQEKLGSYLKGQGQTDGIFRGTVVPGMEAPAPKEQSDLYRLAAQWVRGAAVDWNEPEDGSARRIPLPTYPFAKERHWYIAQPAQKRPEPEFSARYFARKNIRDDLLQVLSRVLNLAPEKINFQKNIGDYGANSIIIMKITRDLEQGLGVKITGREMLEHRTIESLAVYLTQKTEDLRREGSFQEISPGSEKGAGRGDDFKTELLEKFRDGLLTLEEIEGLV